MNRLRSLDPRVSASLSGADSFECQRVALIAVEFAIRRSGLSSPVVDEVLAAARTDSVTPATARLVADLATKLDEQAWDIQDRIESGEASQRDYLRAFSLARAASAVALLPLAARPEGAAEVIYEAAMTVDSPDELWRELGL